VHAFAGPQRAWLGEKLKVRYSKRTSTRELAEANGRSYGLVHRLLVGSSIELRGRGGSQRSSTPAGKAKYDRTRPMPVILPSAEVGGRTVGPAISDD
jgi:hypothetical protein